MLFDILKGATHDKVVDVTTIVESLGLDSWFTSSWLGPSLAILPVLPICVRGKRYHFMKPANIIHFFLIILIIIFFMGNSSRLQGKGGWSLSKSSLMGMSMIGILVDDANGNELI